MFVFLKLIVLLFFVFNWLKSVFELKKTLNPHMKAFFKTKLIILISIFLLKKLIDANSDVDKFSRKYYINDMKK